MDSIVKQTRAQQKQDVAQLPATVVRNIAEIERSYFLACGPMSDRLMTEVADALRKAAPEGWQVVGDSAGPSVIVPDWRSTRGVGRGDAWLEIAEVAEDEDEHSWIAAATGSGSTAMALEVNFRNGFPNISGVLTANFRTAELLKERGFQQADSGNRLFVPIAIDTEALALAFAKEDFEAALAPVRQALELVVVAKGDIDGLIALMRKRGG
jgi:hypothetical protein